ncbi:uncharacterized protein TNCV_4154321 [Trichonephila clavipes]|nr:uncharacterized protein TNCV_4154321 [Trichonephila clavipes]
MICGEGIQCKDTLANNPLGSEHRRIDETDMSTSVEVDQHAANCVEDAVWSFTSYRSLRADVTFRHPLPIFPVFRYSSVHCFQPRIVVDLFRCNRAKIA